MPSQPDADAFELTRVGAKSQPLLEQLFQFYAYDFSELEGDTADRLEFDSHGRFNLALDLDAYWDSASHWAYLLQVRHKPAGFALINTRSHAGYSIDYNMAEFFVARKYRRRGLASAALQALLARHPGKWEVAVLEANETAKSFWPKAILATNGTRDLQVRNHAGAGWTGPIWTFTAVDVKEHASR